MTWDVKGHEITWHEMTWKEVKYIVLVSVQLHNNSEITCPSPVKMRGRWDRPAPSRSVLQSWYTNNYRNVMKVFHSLHCVSVTLCIEIELDCMTVALHGGIKVFHSFHCVNVTLRIEIELDCMTVALHGGRIINRVATHCCKKGSSILHVEEWRLKNE